MLKFLFKKSEIRKFLVPSKKKKEKKKMIT